MDLNFFCCIKKKKKWMEYKKGENFKSYLKAESLRQLVKLPANNLANWNIKYM